MNGNFLSAEFKTRTSAFWNVRQRKLLISEGKKKGSKFFRQKIVKDIDFQFQLTVQSSGGNKIHSLLLLVHSRA